MNKKFKAIISGIIEKGIFLEIEENGIEGFVPSFILNRKDYFYDENLSIYVNKNNNDDIITIGSEFIVSIFNINVKKGFIDFRIEQRIR